MRVVPECFSNSDHEVMRYFLPGSDELRRMLRLRGSDAWDPRGFCSRHGNRDVDPTDALPAKLRQRSKHLFDGIAKFLARSTSILDVSKYKLAIVAGQPENVCSAYRYLHPKATLLESLFFTDMLAASGGNIHNWRLTVALDDDASKLGELGDHIASTFGVECRVVVPTPVEHSPYVKRILEWTLAMCKDSDAFSRLLCDALATPRDETTKPYLEELILYNVSLSHDLCLALHKIFMRLLVDGKFKDRYAVAFSKSYVAMSMAFLKRPNVKESKDLSVEENALFGLSVQFLNRAHFVEKLVYEHKFLTALLVSLNRVITSAVSPSGAIELSHESLKARRHNHAVTDLRYVLQIEGMPRHLCSKRLDLIETWIDTISLVDGADMQSRLFGAHREFPTDQWMYAFNLTLSLSSMFQCILQWLFEPACASSVSSLASDTERLLTVVGGRLLKMIEKQSIVFLKQDPECMPAGFSSCLIPRLNRRSPSSPGENLTPLNPRGTFHFIILCTDFLYVRCARASARAITKRCTNRWRREDRGNFGWQRAYRPFAASRFLPKLSAACG